MKRRPTDDDTTEEHDSYSGRSLFSHLPTEKNVLLPYQEPRRSFEPNIISDSSNDDDEEQEHELIGRQGRGLRVCASVGGSHSAGVQAARRLARHDVVRQGAVRRHVADMVAVQHHDPVRRVGGLQSSVQLVVCHLLAAVVVEPIQSNPIQSNPIQSNPIDQVVVRSESVSLQSKRERERDWVGRSVRREDHRADVGEELGSTASQSHQRGSCRSQTSRLQHQRHAMVEK